METTIRLASKRIAMQAGFEVPGNSCGINHNLSMNSNIYIP